MGNFLGIALYHRQRLPELTSRAARPLLGLLGAPGGDLPTPALRIFVGDEDRGDATREGIAAITPKDLTLGADRPLRVEAANAAVGAVVYDPTARQGRAMSSDVLALVIEAERFDVHALLDLATAVDVRYGFVAVADTADAAWDEALWADPGRLRAPATARRHSDAWFRLMRSFGRPEIGVGVPDVYWANIFGNVLGNELRRLGCWDALESVVSLRYLDNGAVAFSMSPLPRPMDDPSVATRARKVGDIVAPLGLMQRALNQARQGDLLLLDALVESRDARLLHGLAFPQGLDAFRRLADVSEEDVATVDDARRWLAASRDERPRGYGEPPRGVEAPEAVPAPPANAPSESPAVSDTPAEVTAGDGESDAPANAPVRSDASAPAAVRPEALRTATPDGLVAELSFDRDAPQWRIRTMARGALRFELGSVRWTPTSDPGERHLEIDLTNELPCAVELTGVRRVRRTGEAFAVADAAVARGLIPAAGHRHCALTVPAPEGDEGLSLLASIGFRLRVSVADLVVEDGRARLLSAAEGAAATQVHQGWPADVVASLGTAGLALRLRNTMQLAWRSWQVRVQEVGVGRDVGLTHGAGVLGAGVETTIGLEIGARGDGTFQVWLEAEGATELALAEFFHTPH